VKVVQRVQTAMQKRLISRVLEQSGKPPRVPALLRFLLGFRAVRHIPARLFGYGLRQEHVHTPGQRSNYPVIPGPRAARNPESAFPHRDTDSGFRPDEAGPAPE
jgi:hypothetical protein